MLKTWLTSSHYYELGTRVHSSRASVRHSTQTSNVTTNLGSKVVLSWWFPKLPPLNLLSAKCPANSPFTKHNGYTFQNSFVYHSHLMSMRNFSFFQYHISFSHYSMYATFSGQYLFSGHHTSLSSGTFPLGLGVVPFLQANTLACYCFMGAARDKHLGEIKRIVLLIAEQAWAY